MTPVAESPLAAFDRRRRRDCSTQANVTRSLLGYLAVAGPLYVGLSLAQALTRPGFNIARDEWSLLTLGDLGWMQIANLALTGAMLVAGALGIRRAVGRRNPGGTWAPRLLAGYGFALIAAAAFRADPAQGFPPGAPAGRAVDVTWHGTLHIIFGSLGFTCLIAACFVIARSYTLLANRRAAMASRAVGVLFAVAFAGIASGAANTAINLGFTAAVVVSFAWLTAVAADLYRRTRRNDFNPTQSSGALRTVVDHHLAG
jgi:Protein of unknown function (DUF998)